MFTLRNLRTWAISAAVLAATSIVPVSAQQYGATADAMQDAMASYYAGDWDGCISKFEAIMDQTPQDTLALAYILDASYRKNNVDGIVNKYEIAYMASGEAPDPHAHLGLAYYLRGLVNTNALDDALTEFQNAVRDEPTCSMAYTGIGMVYFQKRMIPQSKGYLVRGLRLNGHDVMAMDRLGNILLVDEKKPAEALEIYQRIIEELPTYPDGHYFYGSSLYDLKRYEEALPYLLRCAELDPHGYTQGYDAITLAGDTYIQLKRYDEAKAMFEKALTVRPNSNYAKYKIKVIENPELLQKEETRAIRDDSRRSNSVLKADLTNSTEQLPNAPSHQTSENEHK